ncbi:P-loop containing nucleoside triphosphate hydrolase protein [Rhizoctonia solani]|uniref:P-loop containing nucleoside triphosphate hydrolase protein n=1 Tax=Rhizoctonia solani TaxID=456999 RepID=A0A8H7LZH2_9AGAM|nr:P-loop containing nucleoside triphosphate hydrolase protein [Rhizoctonia solani]
MIKDDAHRGSGSSPTQPHDHSNDSNNTNNNDNNTPAPDGMPKGYSRMDEGPPKPSLKLLFAHCTRHDALTLLLPAIFVSIVSGGIAPFMTRVIGQAFDAFARFPSPAAQESLSPDDLAAVKSRLLREVGLTAIQLLALAGGSLLLGSAMSSLWIWVAEKNVMRLRRGVYEAVTTRRMEWFDAQMSQSEDGTTGAGGMMAKFARDTDDIRTATSLAMGQLIQHLTTVLASLIIALVTSWSLTLIILASIPVLLVLQFISQALAMPRYDRERALLAKASSLTTTSLSAIATIKSFNAQSSTQSRLSTLLNQVRKTAHACSAIWGVTAGGTQFVLFAMFVQGFWFGSALVRKGDITPGQVMGVFWACLIAASNLQMCIPLIVTVSKGKSAAVAVAELLNPNNGVGGDGMVQAQGHSGIPLVRAPTHRIPMRKIVPTRKCQGELSLHNVTFAYPSRPDQIVLKNVSMFIPANEMTFVVGGSGSGKSTVAQVMCGMYKIRSERVRPANSRLWRRRRRGRVFQHNAGGMVVLDDQQLDMLDERWMRKNVALVSQQCIMFDMSVHDNVAIGLAGSRLDGEKVVDACRMALLHDFIRELPEGYDTVLNGGGGGADEEEKAETGNGRISLSGGQRQRLAIARAWIRDPAVLILDEATSALDATARILVFEAIKAWRRNKTTIVITHDLSQIAPSDFVYVMKDGRVVQEGYRYNLQAERGGVFEGMGVDYQGVEDELDEIEEELRGTSVGHSVGRSLGRSTTQDPEEREYAYGMVTRAEARQVDELLEADGRESNHGMGFPAASTRHTSFAPYVQHPSLAGPSMWMLDAIADISGQTRTPVQTYRHRHPSNAPIPNLDFGRRQSSADMSGKFWEDGQGELRVVPVRRSSLQWEPQSPVSPSGRPQSGWPSDRKSIGRRSSLGRKSFGAKSFTPTQKFMRRWTKKQEDNQSESGEDSEEEEVKAFEQEKNMAKASGDAATQQRRIPRERKEAVMELIIEGEESDRRVEEQAQQGPPSLTSVLKRFYPTVPNKLLVLFGLLVSLASGAMTPIFSFLLATLMSEVAAGGQNVPLITRYALFVLLAAAGDGITGGLKFFIMEVAAMNWVTALRERCFERILAQDKRWHDEASNSPVHIAQVLIKDGDDARTLIAVVLGQSVTVVTMVFVGLIWAMVMGWQLTLVGLAVGPVFGVVMVFQVRWSGQIELRNKRAREEVAKQYYNAVANVRAIRAMALESVFRAQFERSLGTAMRTGVQGAFITGCGFGIVNALIYVAEGSCTVLRRRCADGSQGYSYLKMLQALNLVVFSVTIAAQLLSFNESKGTLRFPVDGRISFDRVQFSYPARPDTLVLKDISFQVDQGECVAIVGPSGCGKSTVASLVQRLYEPTGGSIRINKHPISMLIEYYVWLHPHHFEEVQNAAKAAQMHDWIMSQERGYDTTLGEGAALISGGQAQRLQIARALVRQSNILIMDEATSALDPANQDAIMDTVMAIKQDRITLIVTHKLAVMQRCDRILVVQDGVIAESGSYQELMDRGVPFSILLLVENGLPSELLIIDFCCFTCFRSFLL